MALPQDPAASGAGAADPVAVEAGLRIREAARALVLSPDDHVLLVRFEFAELTVWAPPGGGLEADETHEAALRRELAEEVGLVDAPIGAHVWNRLHVIPFLDGRWDGQRERYYVVEVAERVHPVPQMSWDELRAENVYDVCWVAIDEIERLEGPTVLVRPTGLSGLLRGLVRDGYPAQPVDVPV